MVPAVYKSRFRMNETSYYNVSKKPSTQEYVWSQLKCFCFVFVFEGGGGGGMKGGGETHFHLGIEAQ